MQDNEILKQLHDIKPLVKVDDVTIYYFLIVFFIALIILSGITYITLKWYKNRKKEDIRKKHLNIIKKIDLKKTKEAAYALTKYGATFKNDSPRHKEMYNNMINKLQSYKYKKEIKPFDKETISIIELFREICDV